MGIHMANVYLAPLFQGDPCTWYVINFLLDSTIGLFIIYVGIRLCQYIAKTRHIEQLNFGNYSEWTEDVLQREANQFNNPFLLLFQVPPSLGSIRRGSTWD